MQDNLFRSWLTDVDSRPAAQVADNLARARRVEDAGFDLDAAYAQDRGQSVLDALSPENSAFLRAHRLPVDRAGLSSLKTAVRKYVRFRDGLGRAR